METSGAGTLRGTHATAALPLERAIRETWMRRSDDDTSLRIIGITGHLFLDARERERTREQVRREVRTACAAGIARVRFLSGLAPGADLVATDAALLEARGAGLEVELVALLPGDGHHLVDDWLVRAESLRERISRSSRKAVTELLTRLLSAADHIVDLCGSGPDRCERTEAYRRLAVVLADVPDLLIAVRHEHHDGQEGGTAEVLAWREDRAAIPDHLHRFLPRRSSETDVAIIDPVGSGVETVHRRRTPSPSVEATSASIRAHLKAGNALTAYDQARMLVEAGATSPDVRYLFLMSLAATGNAQGALDHYEELAPPREHRNEDWLSLRGRFFKDLAIAGVDPASNFARAAAEYEAAHARTSGLFSGVNASTLSLLIGREDRAVALARALLAQPSHDEAGEEAAYFTHASRGEAWLVLGDVDRCVDELRRANPLLRNDLIARSRTRQQLALVAAHRGIDKAIVRTLALPAVYLLTTGAGAVTAMPADVAKHVEGSPVFVTVSEDRVGLDAMGACADVGARVHLVLASGTQALVGERLAASASVSIARGFLDSEVQWRDAETQRLAHGLARVTAAALGTEVRALSHRGDTWSIGPEPPEAASHASERRRMVGLVFMDAVGFRLLTDDEIRSFWEDLMPVLAQRIAGFGDQVLLTATWGDAIHIVTTGASSAAALSLSLLEDVARFRPHARGALHRIQFRVGAHYAPAFAGHDPAERHHTYYGTQLTFAASVEPVTPPDMVYVTDTLAAQLALEAPGRFQMRYAGDIELAKRFGNSRLHGLTRTADPSSR